MTMRRKVGGNRGKREKGKMFKSGRQGSMRKTE